MRSLDVAEKKRELAEKGKSDMYDYTIAKDMYDQLVFFLTSKCYNAMLKFKVPVGMSLSYPVGKLWIQPFINTNELRLVTTSMSDNIVYNGNDIDSKCQIFNNHWKQEASVQIDKSVKLSNKIETVFKERPNLKQTWDMCALIDVLISSNKLEYLDNALKSYSTRMSK